MAQIVYTTPNGYVFVIDFDATITETHSQAATATEHPVEVGANVSDHVRAQLAKISLEGFVTNTPINAAAVDNAFLVLDGGRIPIGAIPGSPTPFLLQPPEFAADGLTRNRITKYAQVTGGTPGQIAVALDRGLPLVGGLPSRLNGRQRSFIPAVATAGQRTSEDTTVGGTSWQALSPTDRVKAVFDVLMALCRSGRQVQLLTKIYEYPDLIITSVVAPITVEDAIQFSIEFTEVRYGDSRTVDIIKKKPAKPKEKRAEEKKDKGPKPTYKRTPQPRLQSNLDALKDGTLPENESLADASQSLPEE